MQRLTEQKHAPVQRHHRLAVLRVNGYAEEWLAEDGREKHVVARWVRGELSQDGSDGVALWDRYAQAVADAEAFGRGDREHYAEATQRIIDRIDHILADEFGHSTAEPRGSVPPPSAPSGLAGALADVAAFHSAMEQPILDSPQWPGDSRALLRYELVKEEFYEFARVMGVQSEDKDAPALAADPRSQLVDIADALADLVYVALGTMLEFGIPGDRVWAEVQRANLTKAGGPVRADGKRLKPEGWLPPDIERAVFGGIYPSATPSVSGSPDEEESDGSGEQAGATVRQG